MNKTERAMFVPEPLIKMMLLNIKGHYGLAIYLICYASFCSLFMEENFFWRG